MVREVLLDKVTFGRRPASYTLKPNILKRETSKGNPWRGLPVLSSKKFTVAREGDSRGEKAIREIQGPRVLQMAHLKTACLKPIHSSLKS